MKLTKLLVLGVLLLFGTSANATVPDGIWTLPEPEGLEFTTFTDDGTRYYLYNPQTHMFFASGNGWNTMASLRTFGMEVWLSPATEANAPEGSYRLCDNNVNNSARVTNEGDIFTDDADASWVDHGTQANYSWKYEIVGDCVRFQNVTFIAAKADYAGTYIGFDGTYVLTSGGTQGGIRNAYTAILRHVNPSAAGVSVDWKAVTVSSYENFVANEEAYAAYTAGMEKYIAGTELKKALDEAEELGGVDAADQITVYNNTASTQAELTAATTAVTEKIAARKEAIEKEKQEGAYNQATGDNPVVVTNLHITNPSFESSKNQGWTGTDPGYGYTADEFFNTNFDFKQTITDLREGVYALGVQSFYRAGGHGADPGYQRFVANDPANKNVKLYAVVAGDSAITSVVTPFTEAGTEKLGVGSESEVNTANGKIYVPNDMNSAEAYFLADRYHNSVFFESAGSDATIGIKKAQTITNDWVMFDNWSLTYYGKGADAYQAWSDTELAKYTYTPAEGALYTESYMTALTAATASKTAANKAEVQANITAAATACADLEENVALWAEWKKLVEEASKMAYADEYQDFDEILDVMEYADPAEDDALYKAIEAAHNLDNAALTAENEKLNNMMEAVKEAVKNAIQPGQDVTNKLLVNPTFNMLDGDTEKPQYGWTGWGNTTNGMPTTGGLHLSDVQNREDYNLTAEAWSAKEFDLYQEVENAPVGVYEIEVQGFFRYGRGDAGKEAYQAQEVDYVKKGGAPVYVYLNDVKTPFMNIYDEPSQGQEFYATMAQVDETTGEYKKGENGVYQWRGIPYSVQNYPANAEVPDEYYPNGMTSAALAFSAGLYKQTAKSLIAKKGDKMRIGVKGSTQLPENGDCWVIWDNFKLTYLGFEVASVKPLLEDAIEAANKNLEKHFGTDLRATLIEKLDAAQALLNSEDGRAMFNATSELVAVDVDGSVALFEKLEAAVIDMQNFAGAQSEVADGNVVNAAYELGEEISLKLEAFTMSDTEANEYLDKVAEMVAKLKIPAGMENASDDNEVDVTAFITNPRYSENNNDGWAGDGPSVSYHEAEMFNKNFDYYQDLEGLLPGTYMVSLQGFYRAGGHGPANDYNTWLENPEANNNAILYVNAGGNTNQTALKRLCTEMIQLAAGEEISGGWAAAKTDTLSWEPDTVVQHYIGPNTLEEAEKAFLGEDPDYNYSGNEVIFKVGDDGKARIGVKKTALLANDWTLWSNWKLTYYGKNSSKETGILSATSEGRVVKTEYFSLSGSRLKNARGLVIVKQTMSDGRVRVIKKVK